MSSGSKITKNRLKSNKPLLRNEVYSFKSQHWRKMCIRERTSNQFCLLTNTVDFFFCDYYLANTIKANETKDNKNGTSLFAQLKLLYAKSVSELLRKTSKRIFESYIWFSRQIKNSWKISPYKRKEINFSFQKYPAMCERGLRIFHTSPLHTLLLNLCWFGGWQRNN